MIIGVIFLHVVKRISYNTRIPNEGAGIFFIIIIIPITFSFFFYFFSTIYFCGGDDDGRTRSHLSDMTSPAISPLKLLFFVVFREESCASRDSNAKCIIV